MSYYQMYIVLLDFETVALGFPTHGWREVQSAWRMAQSAWRIEHGEKHCHSKRALRLKSSTPEDHCV